MKRLLPLLFLMACTKKDAPSGLDPKAQEAAAPSASVAQVVDAHDVVVKSCLSCHTEAMLQQQRLTEAQWTKVVTKMVSWGANLEPSDQPALIAYLSASYGPDAGAFQPPSVSVTELSAAIIAKDDGPFAGGDVERGKALFVDKCSGCHEKDARGHVGVNLVDRPFLYRADEFAGTIRKGRGKMPPAKIADAEVADILAYLRTLR
jgi:mono/diheme cytochrome c family protein